MLRSPSKFWGIAATRVGVAWCRDRERLSALLGRRETWPISGLDVAVAEVAMASDEWAERARLDLAGDAAWLAAALDELPGRLVEQDVGVHYRCLITEHAEEIAARDGRAWRRGARRSGAPRRAIPARCASSRRCPASARPCEHARARGGRALAQRGLTRGRADGDARDCAPAARPRSPARARAPRAGVRRARRATASRSSSGGAWRRTASRPRRRSGSASGSPQLALGALLAIRGVPRAGGARALRLLALGAIGYAGQSTLFYLSLQRGTAATSILLFYAYPALVCAIGWLALRERRPCRRTCAALALSVAGSGARRRRRAAR